MTKPIDLSNLTGAEPVDPSPGMEPEPEPAQDAAETDLTWEGDLQCVRPVETVQLGGFDLVDALNAPFVAARPKPRGVLPVPPEVEAAAATEDQRLLKELGIVPTPEARQRLRVGLTLQYYYGGYDVAYRVTTRGVEVLAAGLHEIGELVRGKSQEELLTIKIGQP
jgi:hypothetical protein